MQNLRSIDFYKRPGIAETLDWSRALLGLDIETIDEQTLQDTSGVILKYRDDVERLKDLGIDVLEKPNTDQQG